MPFRPVVRPQAGAPKGKTGGGVAGQEKPPPAGKYPFVQVESEAGSVVSVNTALRFVVLDFTLKEMPQVDRRLSLYRAGRKVGEVKVTGPAREGKIAADLISGQAAVGDETREE